MYLSLYDLTHLLSAVASVATVAAVSFLIGSSQRFSFGRHHGETPTDAGMGTRVAAARREATAASRSPDSNTGDKVTTRGGADGV